MLRTDAWITVLFHSSQAPLRGSLQKLFSHELLTECGKSNPCETYLGKVRRA